MTEIRYPVFLLGRRKPFKEGSVTLFLTQIVEDDESILLERLIVDDTSAPGSSIGLRRLYLLKSGVQLYKIRQAVYFLSDIVKLSTGSKVWFVDSDGIVFSLEKSRFVPLIFRKITKVIPIPTGGAILEVEGIPGRFKTLYMPAIEEKYAGILKDGLINIFYGYYKHKLPDTRRKI